MPFLDRYGMGRLSSVWHAPRASAPPSLKKASQPSVSLSSGDFGSRLCAAPECTSSWNRTRKQQRPLFEGQWACGARCLESLVRAAVRRAAIYAQVEKTPGPHRHRVPLGLVLLAQRWITQAQLQEALQQQRELGKGRIGDHLVQRCGLAPDRVTRGLAMQWSCPVLTLEGFEPQRMAMVMPAALREAYSLIPLRSAGTELLYLASATHLDASVASAVEKMSGMRVECGLVGEEEFGIAAGRLDKSTGASHVLRTVQDSEDLVLQVTKILQQSRPLASRLARVHGTFWLRLWLESGALAGTGTVPPGPEDVEDLLFELNTGQVIA